MNINLKYAEVAETWREIITTLDTTEKLNEVLLLENL